MKYISSVHNEHIKHAINLATKSYRYEHQQFLVEGSRACLQILEKYQPVVIYMTEKYYKHHILAAYEEYIVCLADHVMDKICTSKHPSGICIIFTIPTPQALPTKGNGLVLLEISDPGNLGTLLRTAAAMNVTQIILVGGTDPYGPKVIQSTAGCITNLTLYSCTFEQLTMQNLPLCALVAHHGKHPQAINLHNKFLVVGNEAHGLSPEHIAICQDKMTIPMPGKAESLNAAVAGSIGLYLMTSITE